LSQHGKQPSLQQGMSQGASAFGVSAGCAAGKVAGTVARAAAVSRVSIVDPFSIRIFLASSVLPAKAGAHGVEHHLGMSWRRKAGRLRPAATA
jgi:hypothetical protein